MAEQLNIPEGGAPAADTIPTFGDLPESNFTGGLPRIMFADVPEEAPADEPASPAPEPTPTSPAVEFAPPPSGSLSGPGLAQELFQANVAVEEWKEQRAQQKERSRQSAEWKPPELTEAQAEEMLTDREKFRAGIAARDAWHRNSTIQTVQPIYEKVQQLESQLQEVNYRQHTDAWNDVRDEMQAKGVNADAYYGPIMQSLQSNPNTLWQIAKNPAALRTAVEILHQQSGAPSTFSAPPQEAKAPPTVGQSSAAPSKKDAAGSNYNHPAIEQAEKVFGKPFTKAMREEFRRTIQGARQ